MRSERRRGESVRENNTKKSDVSIWENEDSLHFLRIESKIYDLPWNLLTSVFDDRQKQTVQVFLSKLLRGALNLSW